jgi:hypothetical protein
MPLQETDDGWREHDAAPEGAPDPAPPPPQTPPAEPARAPPPPPPAPWVPPAMLLMLTWPYPSPTSPAPEATPEAPHAPAAPEATIPAGVSADAPLAPVASEPEARSPEALTAVAVGEPAVTATPAPPAPKRLNKAHLGLQLPMARMAPPAGLGTADAADEEEEPLPEVEVSRGVAWCDIGGMLVKRSSSRYKVMLFAMGWLEWIIGHRFCYIARHGVPPSPHQAKSMCAMS